LNKLENNQDRDILDFKETAELLHVKPSRLRTLIFKKEIPVIRLGRTLRFSRQDLIQWLDGKKENIA
jgi:excisionase family DNA binding protein